MRVAVVDCGTNTVRLLIADVNPAGALAEVTRQLRFVRLGEGIDESGSFSAEALRRAFGAFDEFAAVLRQACPDRVRFVATSAARDASNREEFFAGVRERLGVEADVICGKEEAELSFRGACAGGQIPARRGVIVTDIGGGSTEVVRGWSNGSISSAVSIDMGSVRVRERFFRHDPPTPSEVDEARACVAGLLDAPGSVFPGPGDGPPEAAPGQFGSCLPTWIGVAGTCTSLSAMNQRLADYDRDAVHDSVMTVGEIESLADRLLGMRVDQLCPTFPSLQPQRAAFIASGALICAELARRINVPMMVRETDILDGVAMGLVTAPE